MKICFLAGANSVHSTKWVKFFTDRGHEVSWISLTPNTQGEIEGVRFFQLMTPYPFCLLKLRSLLRSLKPDILHAHYAGRNGTLAAFSGFHPFVLTAWGSDILFAGRSGIKGLLVRYALAKADLITCDADHMKNAMMELGANPEKIRIVYFGIDTKAFEPGPRDEAISRTLNLGGAPTVISTRSLKPVYDIDTLIWAIPRVLEKKRDAVFIIGGTGSEEERLKRMASDLGVASSIRFVGWVAQEEMIGYLRAADVYVSTSLSDGGISSSTAEAMACGIPVVVTNTGENGKWVRDGREGFLIPVRSPDVLAEKILVLLDDEEARNRMGRSGRAAIVERNDYEREMDRMEKIYEENLAARKTSA